MFPKLDPVKNDVNSYFGESIFLHVVTSYCLEFSHFVGRQMPFDMPLSLLRRAECKRCVVPRHRHSRHIHVTSGRPIRDRSRLLATEWWTKKKNMADDGLARTPQLAGRQMTVRVVVQECTYCTIFGII